MYIDEIKLFTKNKKELKRLIQTERIYSQDIGMEFGIEKCAMLIMKRGKRETTAGIEQSDRKGIRTFGMKENYKDLGILEVDTVKLAEMKEKK